MAIKFKVTIFALQNLKYRMDVYLINQQNGNGNTNIVSENKNIETLKFRIKCLEKENSILKDLVKALKGVLGDHFLKDKCSTIHPDKT